MHFMHCMLLKVVFKVRFWHGTHIFQYNSYRARWERQIDRFQSLNKDFYIISVANMASPSFIPCYFWARSVGTWLWRQVDKILVNVRLQEKRFGKKKFASFISLSWNRTDYRRRWKPEVTKFRRLGGRATTIFMVIGPFVSIWLQNRSLSMVKIAG